MARKPRVIIPQETYLNVFHDIDLEWLILEDIADCLDVSESTARRKLDGLVAQGKLIVRPGYLRAYRLPDVRD